MGEQNIKHSPWIEFYMRIKIINTFLCFNLYKNCILFLHTRVCVDAPDMTRVFRGICWIRFYLHSEQSRTAPNMYKAVQGILYDKSKWWTNSSSIRWRGWTSPGHLPGRSGVNVDFISVFAPEDPVHLSGVQNNIVILQWLQASKKFL